MIEGGCLCGAVRYRVTAAPHHVTHCHCLDCRGASGAPFVTWAECRSETVTIEGETRSYSSRDGVERRFCPRCGTQLTFQRLDQSSTIDLTVASFDDPEAVEPDDHLWHHRAIRWAEIDDRLPRYGSAR